MKYKYYLRGLGMGIFITALILTISHHAGERISARELAEEAKASSETLSQTASQEEDLEEPQEQEEPEERAEASESGSLVPDGTNAASGKEEESASAQSVGQNAIPKGEPAPESVSPVPEEPVSTVPEETDLLPQEESPASEETDLLSQEESPAPDETAPPQEESPASEPASSSPEESPASEPASTPQEESTSSGMIQITISKGASSDRVAKLLYQAGAVESASDFDAYLCRNGYDKRIHTGVKQIPAGAEYKEIAEIITTGEE